MKTVNIHDAKTRLSKRIDAAAKGGPFKDRAPRPNTCAAIISACSDF
jgi:hypothetical protein